ncbi:ABC transporter substrate-binding protein [Cryobacterium sp. 10C3]|uniref:ABC transporter substrate-binding protein n=1 Tax=Cryobacterium sp. 10C3 TaxID=3048577 RepID=UPI002AB44E4A|nr:ABC transporter substrate-binding protein [Cryobacterium sp. 10C3]MDY7555282.1 ABC transporter substrate-binding protein [Cryobacterium sp. 10C3]
MLGAFVGVAVVTSGLLSGCSTGQSPAASSTLKVLAWKGGGTEPAGVAEVNAAFEKSHPGVKIDFTYMPAGDSYTQKLSAELLAGNAPDVFMGDPVSTKTLASSGYLADLGKQSWASDVLPDLKSFTEGSDGKVYAAPTELIGITTYANMDLLKKVGITEVPTTRSIFLDDMAKLKVAGITPLSPRQVGMDGAGHAPADRLYACLSRRSHVGSEIHRGEDQFRPRLVVERKAVGGLGLSRLRSLEVGARHRRMESGPSGFQGRQECILGSGCMEPG